MLDSFQLRIGFNNSISGGILNAIAESEILTTNTIQIFLHSPRVWEFDDISIDDAKIFRKEVKTKGINPIVVHSSYLLSPLSEISEKVKKTKDLLTCELMNADLIHADYYVFHLRENKAYNFEKNIELLLEFFSDIPKPKFVKILLENLAVGITSDISDLVEVYKAFKQTGLFGGLCIDSAHAYQAGYDIATDEGIDALLSAIGDKRIVKLIHLNDSKTKLASRIDRHEHIGKGKIGIDGFKRFFSRTKFYKLPIILETPRQSLEDDIKNLAVVKKHIFSIESHGEEL